MNLLSLAEKLAGEPQAPVAFDAARCLHSGDNFADCDACVAVWRICGSSCDAALLSAGPVAPLSRANRRSLQRRSVCTVLPVCRRVLQAPMPWKTSFLMLCAAWRA